MNSYLPMLEMRPVQRIQGEVRVPGSKSYTNRALVAAVLAQGESLIEGALRSEDTELMVAALKTLGFSVEPAWYSGEIKVRGQGGRIPSDKATLEVGNAGTVMRFLTPLAALGRGEYFLTGGPRMEERPVKDLIGALQSLGVNAFSVKGNGCPPVRVTSRGLPGGSVKLPGDASSQFVSGLLLSAPCAQGPFNITVLGNLASKPYVDMTLSLMEAFGVHVAREGYRSFHVSGAQKYRGTVYKVEPDASAATCLLAAPLVAGGEIRVRSAPRSSLQADAQFLEVLRRMGASVRENNGLTEVIPGPALKGVDEDLNSFSDSVPSLAALACFAQGPTRIRNVALVRRKESDRIGDMARELRKLGAEVKEFPDGMEIRPAPLHGAELETYNDHRLAMAFALIGLKVPGVRVQNPGCVSKTYPRFFEDLESVCVR